MREQPGWGLSTSGAGALSLTKPATAGKQYVIFSLSMQRSGLSSTVPLLELRDGSTVVWQGCTPVNTNGTWVEVTFSRGIAIKPGNAVTLIMLASAGAGVLTLNMHGVTLG